MGLFEFKSNMIERKKEKLIKKLSVAEENAQKRSILDEKYREIDSLQDQINVQKSTGSNRDTFGNIKDASVGITKSGIGIGKSISSGMSTVGSKIGGALGKMQENKEAFEKKQKEKKDKIDKFGFF